jgi:tRNA G10  N-methylase Trm11
MINLALECSVTSWSDGKLALPESKAFDPTKKRLSETKVPEHSNHKTLLDPFCGTGVILQEAALMNFQVYGTDLEQRMIDYSEENLQWLKKIYHTDFEWQLSQGDATDTKWQQPVDLIATETYLGRPFTSEPSSEVLQKTIADCNLIIKKFLQNIASQTKPGTRFCVAVPAWFIKNKVYHLSLLDDLRNIGYNRLDFKHASFDDLIYHREGQIVGRELLVLTRR